MKIQNLFQGRPETERCPSQLVAAGGAAQSKDAVLAAEHMISVFINETLAMELVCSPDLLAELVLGRLLTEGIILGIDDVEQLYICEFASRCRVFLAPSAPRPLEAAVESVPSCCTGNRVLMRPTAAPIEPVVPVDWRPEQVFALANAFSQGTPMHRATFGVHSCFLAIDGEILYRCEDLGRHNAMDKVIGRAMLDGVDLRRCMLYTSGRVPTDMMLKVIRAGIPVLVSKAVPTDLAVELAKENGVTLICSAHPDCFRVYSGMEHMRM